jgi:hypothetical protein
MYPLQMETLWTYLLKSSLTQLAGQATSLTSRQMFTTHLKMEGESLIIVSNLMSVPLASSQDLSFNSMTLVC